MTAHLASIGPVGWAAIVVGSLIVFGACVAPSFRAARAFIDSCDPGEDEHVNWMPTLPKVPQPVVVDQYLADQPAEVVEGAELHRRFFAIVDAETRWFA